LAAAISAGVLALLFLPVYLVVGYVALWLLSNSPTALRPLGIGLFGASALAIATIIYMGNHGNWNQPGRFWVFIMATGGIVLLGVNVFAIYLRYFTANGMAHLAGPTLLLGSAIGYWWLLHVEGGRADLYMFRADTVLAGLYFFLGLLLAVNRTQPNAPPNGGPATQRGNLGVIEGRPR
jgi:hypothetical protein